MFLKIYLKLVHNANDAIGQLFVVFLELKPILIE